MEKDEKAPIKQYNKYSKVLADKIIELYGTGKWLIKDVAGMVNIHPSTYYIWIKQKPYLRDGIDNVRFQRLQDIADRAESGLMKLVDVYKYEEKKTEYENVKIADEANPGKFKMVARVKGHSVTEKIIMPQTRAIEYALNNVRKDDWKNTAHIDHTTGGETFSFASFLTNPETQLEDTNDTTSETNETAP